MNLPRLWWMSALAAVLIVLGTPVSAHADGDSNEIGACLESGQVWLVVVTDTRELLANQCVGTPATGAEALQSADLRTSRDGPGFICAIGGYPERCPMAFNGQFWNYFQGSPGAQYSYSSLGADIAKPKPGSIEAWCYNGPDEQSCTPPLLKIVQDGQELAPPEGATTLDLPTGESARNTILSGATDADGQQAVPTLRLAITVGIVVLAAATVGLLLRRRRAARRDERAGPR